MWLKLVSSMLRLMLISLLVCCADGRSRSNSADDSLIEAEWNRNVAAIEAAVNGGSVTEEEFAKACLFFERLTGISVSTDMTYVGMVATDDTGNDLLQVKQWLKTYKHQLCWNSSSQTTELCETK